ncbi:hypothetical protein BZG36_00131 [Bifiguratus adelaidae]|uniref:Uncharacterized protein n=1 Tax=Bifiguratus adelaidae TaxID=1938954 RepID=A0A261Y904_9FUNG|nr:hypothetical protein BZG36_00131 [Bifiguratus adelaidae]
MSSTTTPSVLLITSSLSGQAAMGAAKDKYAANGAQVAFEMAERFTEAPVPPGSYNTIIANALPPHYTTHSASTLSKLLATLTPSGILNITEPVFTEPMANSICPVQQTSAEFVSSCKLAGFVNVVVTESRTITDEELTSLFSAWGASRIEQGVERLSGKVGLVTVTAQKPAYEVGQKVALNFAKKAKPATVWTLATNDDTDDIELEDEDALLDESDKIKPTAESLARPDDCEMTDGKRKACKNCTCGRAEIVNLDFDMADDLSDSEPSEAEIINVDPTPKKVGGCGSCALGDAFRCATCPYLGMPAFNPGEKVVLGGVFGGDDL